MHVRRTLSEGDHPLFFNKLVTWYVPFSISCLNDENGLGAHGYR
jgi:hypothetical protein